MGKRIRAAPKKKWVQYQLRNQDIVLQYADNKLRGERMQYLRALAHTIVL